LITDLLVSCSHNLFVIVPEISDRIIGIPIVRILQLLQIDSNCKGSGWLLSFEILRIKWVWNRRLKHVARGQHVAREGILCGPRCFLGIFK